MPNPENLDSHKFKKGQSGNPRGRPKGARSRSTIVQEWLECSEMIVNPLTGKNQRLQESDIITLALIKKARKGDVQAFKELMDSGYGRTVNQIDHTTGGEKLNPIPAIHWVKDKKEDSAGTP
jgi:hypothetical protein